MGFKPDAHLIDLKGKAYLEVKWRLYWFREEKPLWSISTELLKLTLEGPADSQFALFRATISDENGLIKAVAHGSETKRDFGDFIEKAESKAVGRALGYLGYGTQFAPDLEEGSRIVDSPVDRGGKGKPPAQERQEKPAAEFTLQEALDTVPFKSGPKAGMKMAVMDRGDLEFLVGAQKASPTLRAKAKAVLESRNLANGKATEADEPIAEEPPDEYMRAQGVKLPN